MTRMLMATAKFPFQLIYDLVILIVTFLKGQKNEN
jgi:hypothetical protein